MFLMIYYLWRDKFTNLARDLKWKPDVFNDYPFYCLPFLYVHFPPIKLVIKKRYSYKRDTSYKEKYRLVTQATICMPREGILRRSLLRWTNFWTVTTTSCLSAFLVCSFVCLFVLKEPSLLHTHIPPIESDGNQVCNDRSDNLQELKMLQRAAVCS